MQFIDVGALLAWAFAMRDCVPLKVQKFSDSLGAEFGSLTPAEQKIMAMDVLAKVGRLKSSEQSVIAAYYTGDVRAVKQSAALLPAGWPQPLRIELARCWSKDQVLERSQQEMAEVYMLSQPTVFRRKAEAFSLLDKVFSSALSVVELQVADVLKRFIFRRPVESPCKAA